MYFSTDSVDLSTEAQQTLANQARWLQQYAQYTITIEGHADERGTREYNIALGAKRAQAVRDYLARHGINAGRIRTVSYGKERPVAVCNDISCWSQNRRAADRAEQPPRSPFLSAHAGRHSGSGQRASRGLPPHPEAGRGKPHRCRIVTVLPHRLAVRAHQGPTRER